MPPVFSKTRPSTVQPFPLPLPGFAFPINKHLLITTPSRIVSQDASGIHELLTSSKSGIAAATESKDGCGVLAVADKRVVVLHDTQRGREKSWGLCAQDDEVRHLEYTKDSKNLFLTTTATNAVQCYSTQAQQLLSPPQTLSSPAVALAISPTGHLMISAQGTPPVVFLKNLNKNSTATMVKPQASAAGIALAAFHPEKANIFLLAFDDGTLAVFDASRLQRGIFEGTYNAQKHASKAEIGRKRQLHKPMHFRNEDAYRAIAGAAFLPGHCLRTITVGIDGRCKLLDFSDGVNVLRTWHCEVPLTCVSVMPLQNEAQEFSAKQKGKSAIRATNLSNLIAIGTQNGKVLIYDTLGLLQSDERINSTGERIISVEWVHGSSPKSVQPVMAVPEGDGEAQATTSTAPTKVVTGHGTKRTTPKHLSVHPALRPSTTKLIASPSLQSRRFTIHPDEVRSDSTVRHTPNPDGSPMVSAEAGEYLDLFSPVNPFAARKTRARREQSFSPSRVRPRLSSQTFAQGMQKSLVLTPKGSTTRGLTLSPAIESHATSSSSLNPPLKRNVLFRSTHGTSKSSPLRSERRKLNPVSSPKKPPFSTNSADKIDANVTSNARLLRDLRQMGAETSRTRTSRVLQSSGTKDQKPTELFANQSPSLTSPRITGSASLHPESSHAQVHVYGSGGRWPTDSVDEPSWSDEQQDDIWITSDEERDKTSRRIHGIERPAARQTSRSRMGSMGTVSTTRATAGFPTAVPPIHAPQQTTAHQTSNDDYTTAHSHASPDGTFSLAPEDVKSLFPRTSSKSPKISRDESKKRTKETPRYRKTALQEIASNKVLGRRPSDPWTKVKQLKELADGSAEVVQSNDRNADSHAAHPDTRGEACEGCTTNAKKVQALEGEVTHMKGEILALRAMLRRHGIPTAAVPRQ